MESSCSCVNGDLELGGVSMYLDTTKEDRWEVGGQCNEAVGVNQLSLLGLTVEATLGTKMIFMRQ